MEYIVAFVSENSKKFIIICSTISVVHEYENVLIPLFVILLNLMLSIHKEGYLNDQEILVGVLSSSCPHESK